MRFPLLFLVLCFAPFIWAAPKAKIPVPKIEPVIQESFAQYSWQFAISPDRKWIVSGGTPQLWNTRGELLHNLEAPRFGGQIPVFARDGRRFFLTQHPVLEWQDGTTVYALPSGRKIADIAGVEVSNDARFFIRRGEKTTRISDAETGKPLATIPLNAVDLSLDFSPDGNFVAVGETSASCRDGKMRIWSLKTGKLVRTLSDSRPILAPVLWSGDGKILVTGAQIEDCESVAIQVWDVQSGKLRQSWPGFAFLREWISPREVVLGEERDTILDITTGKARRNLGHPVSNAPQIVFGSYSLSSFELRDASGTKTLQKFPLRSFGAFSFLAYSPDGALLAASRGWDGRIQIYQAHSGAPLQTLQIHDADSGIDHLRWLSDGNLSVSSPSKIWVWRRQGKSLGATATRLIPKATFYNSASLAPDGQWAFSYLVVAQSRAL